MVSFPPGVVVGGVKVLSSGGLQVGVGVVAWGLG